MITYNEWEKYNLQELKDKLGSIEIAIDDLQVSHNSAEYRKSHYDLMVKDYRDELDYVLDEMSKIDSSTAKDLDYFINLIQVIDSIITCFDNRTVELEQLNTIKNDINEILRG